MPAMTTSGVTWRGRSDWRGGQHRNTQKKRTQADQQQEARQRSGYKFHGKIMIRKSFTTQ